MKHTLIYIILITAFCTTLPHVRAQNDESQSDLRINPDISADKTSDTIPVIEYPAYINLNANHIEMNGADWTELARTVLGADSARVNIVHIGDSHLQADMATAVTRQRLGDRYGSAGRALVVPFKLAGTNEPVDYAITSDVEVEKSRLLKTPWPTEMGFTGIAVRPTTEKFEITLSTKEPFDSVTVYYSGSNPPAIRNECRVSSHHKSVGVALDDTCSALTLQLESPSEIDIHGFNLLCGKSGIAYHVIGNNGATYGTYNGIAGFSEDIAQLNPALIILSLGTNEAFGRMTDAEMRTQMRILVSGLKKTCPGAQFLITTPAECQRKIYRGKGRKRRSAGYSVNTNVKRLRNAMIDFAKSESIPVYDFYAVAGGDGSSARWLKDGTMNKDRVHLLRPGYVIQGNLFTDALEEALHNEK